MPDHASLSQAPNRGVTDPSTYPSTIARPYGPIGLTLSTIAILLATALLLALAAGLTFAVAVASVGWHDVAHRVATFDFRGGQVAGQASRQAGHHDGVLEHLGIVLSLALYAAFSLSVLGAARLCGGARGWRALVAWRRWHPFRGSALVWGLLALTLVYSFGANLALEWLYPASKDWVQLPSGRLWAALFVVLAVVAAPITEELFFRGWLFTGLRSRVGAIVTIAVTSVLFALAHWEKTHLYALAVLPVGLALGLIRERTGTIGATMAFHAGYNGFASVLLLFGQ